MVDQITLGTSDDVVDDFSCGGAGCRWGAYASASFDPADPNVVWGTSSESGPKSGTTPVWETRNFALELDTAVLKAAGKVKRRLKSRGRTDKLQTIASIAEDARVRVSGKLQIRGGGKAAAAKRQRIALKPKRRKLDAGDRKKLKLKPKQRRHRKTASRGLHTGKKVKAVVKFVFRDAFGNKKQVEVRQPLR
jgi:hypothetical protein